MTGRYLVKVTRVADGAGEAWRLEVEDGEARRLGCRVRPMVGGLRQLVEEVVGNEVPVDAIGVRFLSEPEVQRRLFHLRYCRSELPAVRSAMIAAARIALRRIAVPEGDETFILGACGAPL